MSNERALGLDQGDKLIATIKAGDLATFNDKLWDPSTWPKEAKGVGFMEAPRGALAHWIVIEIGRIANYQLVVPSTWNASPRDGSGQRSAYEAALLDTPIADPEQPIEVLRTIHSFDPCIACAVHLYDEEGRGLSEVRVLLGESHVDDDATSVRLGAPGSALPLGQRALRRAAGGHRIPNRQAVPPSCRGRGVRAGWSGP